MLLIPVSDTVSGATIPITNKEEDPQQSPADETGKLASIFPSSVSTVLFYQHPPE